MIIYLLNDLIGIFKGLDDIIGYVSKIWIKTNKALFIHIMKIFYSRLTYSNIDIRKYILTMDLYNFISNNKILNSVTLIKLTQNKSRIEPIYYNNPKTVHKL